MTDMTYYVIIGVHHNAFLGNRRRGVEVKDSIKLGESNLIVYFYTSFHNRSIFLTTSPPISMRMHPKLLSWILTSKILLF